jgi:hypothetical protein
MKKQSPTSSEDSLHDPPGYIEPSCQDLLLTDITAENLPDIARDNFEIDYLSAAQFPGQFPAKGHLVGVNHRLMINLVCRRPSGQEVPALNVVFLIDTGSPVSYLSKRAVEALIGKRSEHFPRTFKVVIHNGLTTECNISPSGSHFEDVNVLGMDYLFNNRLWPVMDYVSGTFNLQ